MSSVLARLSLAGRLGRSHQFAPAAMRAKRPSGAASMEGKICVITGATSGIGRAAAAALAGMGARIVMIARDEQRGQAMLTKLRYYFPHADHSVYYADLLRLADVN